MKFTKNFHFKVIESTQIQAKSKIDELEPEHGIIITADEQTAGVGTRNRQWVSPPNVNLYVSYAYLKENTGNLFLQNVPQIAAYSVIEVLQQYGFKPTYKWVNDVLLEGKKICGILAESHPVTKYEKSYYAILIGMGFNINMTEIDLTTENSVKLKESVTSLKMVSGKEFDKQEILTLLNIKLAKNLEILHTQGFEPFSYKVNEILERFNLTPQYFDLTDENNNHQIVKGKIKEISADGYLVLDVAGKECKYHYGRLLKEKEITEYEITCQLKANKTAANITHSGI